MPTKAQWVTILFSLAYFTLAFVCLSRFDIYAGSFLGLLALSTVYELILGLPTLRSSAALREASGMAYDSATLVVMAVLSMGDFLVFLDYGHRQLITAVHQRAFQGAGLVLTMTALAWIGWTDTRLTRYFAQSPSHGGLLQNGPFRYVRHPRYAGILGVRLAFALVFSSLVGWALAIAWTIVVLRRIRLEERYLQQRFGREHQAYAGRTPRLIPGVY